MGRVMNKEFAMELENAEIEALDSRLTAIKEIEGNPMGIEVRKFGHATAFCAKNIPGPSFNTVKGLAADDAKYVEKIIDFYHEKEIPVRFELTPGHVSSDLLAHLNQMDFYQSDFHTTLYKADDPLTAEETFEPDLSIRELKEDEFDIFAEIYTKGFQMPAVLRSGVAMNNQVLYNNPYWTFYLASINQIPSGVGVLFRKNRTATLAAAATIPSQRNKGIHSALIKKRMAQASIEGCNLMIGQARFGSVSQNNMEKAGMKIGYTKAIWVEKPCLRK